MVIALVVVSIVVWLAFTLAAVTSAERKGYGEGWWTAIAGVAPCRSAT